jgi:hypothetical protein
MKSTKNHSFITNAFFSLIALTGIAGVYSHGVQVAHCVKPDGFLRIYVEHWHGNIPLSSFVGSNNNNDITIADLVTNTQGAVDPIGVVWNTNVNNLPECGNNIVLDTGCPGRANRYNDWAFYDYQPTCNVPVSYRLLQGNSVYFAEACSQLYPVDITGTFLDNSPPILKVNGHKCDSSSTILVPDVCTPQLVTFNAEINDACDPSPLLSISHSSGDVFPTGCTVVSMTGHDNASPSNSDSCYFQVCLTPPLAGCCPSDNSLNSVIKNVSCKGDSTGNISLNMNDGAPPFSFLWSNGKNDSYISNLYANTYNVTSTDSNNCKITKSFVVSEPSNHLSVVTSNNSWVLAGWSGSECKDISASYTGGTGSINISWDHGPSSNKTTVCPTEATSYTATVTDNNGCSTTDSVDICTLNVVPSNQKCVAGGVNKLIDPIGPDTVNLGKAGNFVILSKAGVTNVPPSVINGDIGVSPISQTAVTGFSLTLDETGTFSTSIQVKGRVYAASSTSPTPSDLTTTILDMQAAYVDAAGRTNPDYIEFNTGILGGLTVKPGLYKFSTSVGFLSDCTLSGTSTDKWIFQISGDLTISNYRKIILTGGAKPENIVWVVAGYVEIGTYAHFKGIILGATAANLRTGSSIDGRLLVQTAVTLQKTTVNTP